MTVGHLFNFHCLRCGRDIAESNPATGPDGGLFGCAFCAPRAPETKVDVESAVGFSDTIGEVEPCPNREDADSTLTRRPKC